MSDVYARPSSILFLQLTDATEPAQVSTGDTRLSCEARVCLAAVGNAPGECSKALAKYEAMKAATAFYPLALYNFLKLCPKK